MGRPVAGRHPDATTTASNHGLGRAVPIRPPTRSGHRMTASGPAPQRATVASISPKDAADRRANSVSSINSPVVV